MSAAGSLGPGGEGVGLWLGAGVLAVALHAGIVGAGMAGLFGRAPDTAGEVQVEVLAVPASVAAAQAPPAEAAAAVTPAPLAATAPAAERLSASAETSAAGRVAAVEVAPAAAAERVAATETAASAPAAAAERLAPASDGAAATPAAPTETEVPAAAVERLAATGTEAAAPIAPAAERLAGSTPDAPAPVSAPDRVVALADAAAASVAPVAEAAAVPGRAAEALMALPSAGPEPVAAPIVAATPPRPDSVAALAPVSVGAERIAALPEAVPEPAAPVATPVASAATAVAPVVAAGAERVAALPEAPTAGPAPAAAPPARIAAVAPAPAGAERIAAVTPPPAAGPERLTPAASPPPRLAAAEPAPAAAEPPAQPPETGREREGVAAAPAAQTPEEANATYRSVLDFLAGYPAGPCFAALPSLSAEGRFQFETFARDAADLARFRLALERQTGALPNASMKPVTEAQCRALAFVQKSPAYPSFKLYFDLAERAIASGGVLEGTIGNTSSGFVSLLLIDDEGKVQDLTTFLRFSRGAAHFAIPMTLTAGPVETQQLLMAISTPAGLQSLRQMSGEPADKVFAAISLELVMKHQREDIALVAFSVR